MGIVVADTPFVLYVILGDTYFYPAGLVVGAALLSFAFVLRIKVEKELSSS